MDEVIISKAVCTDKEEIYILLTELSEELYNTKSPEKKIVFKHLESLFKNENVIILIAKANNTSIGLIFVNLHLSLLHNNASGLIEEFIVTKRYRGKGVDKKLISTALKECVARGCEELEVSTQKENKKAQDFYEKSGFELSGLLFEIDL